MMKVDTVYAHATALLRDEFLHQTKAVGHENLLAAFAQRHLVAKIRTSAKRNPHAASKVDALIGRRNVGNSSRKNGRQSTNAGLMNFQLLLTVTVFDLISEQSA